VTVAVGCYVVIFGNDYVVGTIIAIFALARLWSAGKPVMVMEQAAPALPTQPMATFDAPRAYGNGAVPGQPAAPPAESYQPPATTPFYPAPAPFYPATEHVPYPPAPERLPD
jgi:hypothetical protein